MKTVEELSSEVLDYLYDNDHYEMTDSYNTREEAYEDLLKVMSSEKGLLTEMLEELNMLLKYEDLSNPILKKRYEDCTSICYDLNVFINDRNKNKDNEM